MKAQIVSAALLLLIGGGMQACKKAPQKANSHTSAGLTENKGIVTQTLSYTNNGKAYKSFLAFDESKKENCLLCLLFRNGGE